MNKSVFSDIAKINKTEDVEKTLSELSGGEIIRYAIIDVTPDCFVISYSHKE